MNGALLAIAAGASLTCSPVSVAPYLGHWQRSDSKQDTMDISRQGENIIVKTFSNGHEEAVRKGIQTVDGRIVVQSTKDVAVIIGYDKAKSALNAGSYTYMKR